MIPEPARSWPDRVRAFGPFIVWALWFEVGWAVLVTVLGRWGELAAEWPIAAAMLVGSYLAGSTPMGGGAVAFPILVLLFGEPPALGRSFSFAIQSVGMISAVIFMLCAGRAIVWRFLGWVVAAAAVTIPVASAFLVPRVSDGSVKLVFACVWAAFGVLTLTKLPELLRARRIGTGTGTMDAVLGVGTGLVGGVAASMTGVGIEMAVFCVLVLVYRCELRAAIGTAVAAMGFASLAGVLSAAWMGQLGPEVLRSWLAAAPIVVLGAPMGALAVALIPRRPTIVLVALLCLGQFGWTCWHMELGWAGVGAAAGAVAAINGVLQALYVWGRRSAATPVG